MNSFTGVAIFTFHPVVSMAQAIRSCRNAGVVDVLSGEDANLDGTDPQFDVTLQSGG